MYGGGGEYKRGMVTRPDLLLLFLGVKAKLSSGFMLIMIIRI